MKAWKLVASELLLDRRWLKLWKHHVRLPSGVEIPEFHVVEGSSWVATLALTEPGQVILVDQYRHGIRAISRELPAGVIDGRETPLQAAQRELLEETGYVADDWQPLLSVATEPSRHTTRAEFFVARGARRVSAPKPDASEDIDVVLLEPSELLAELDAGRIQHGVHVGAILMAERLGWLRR